ncbi:MAG: hypothetical protein HYY48_02695 [Gammaproteobacteria bacterium]|nr:hypothetical protein [Gammaproteobacteria bacterium]
MEGRLPEADLERAYELIAEAIDRAGAEKESRFLARLCLALAAQLEGLDRVETAIRISESDPAVR